MPSTPNESMLAQIKDIFDLADVQAVKIQIFHEHPTVFPSAASDLCCA